MNTKITFILVAVLSCCAEINAEDTLEPLGVPPKLSALDQTAWRGIQAAHQAAQHAFQKQGSKWSAANSSQAWNAHFDGHGFEAKPAHAQWSWGLKIKSYGYPGHKHEISHQAETSVTGSKLIYQWSVELQEWFINDPQGLEHGFVLADRPPTSGSAHKLEFDFAVLGDLMPEVTKNGRDVLFVNAERASVINYQGLKVWDADGKMLKASFEATTDRSSKAILRLSIEDAEARYPITMDPIAQQAYIKASHPDIEDRFGWSVAISGNTAVMGAYAEDSAASVVNGDESDDSLINAGAAYVFVRSGSTWTQQAYLKASNPGAGDEFGYSVAISGDTIVVGSHREDSAATSVNGDQNDNTASSSGAAYVFKRHGSTWTQEAYLKANNAQAEDYFGAAVSIFGDTVVVGAWAEDSAATGVNGDGSDNALGLSGAAYIFTRAGSDWSQQAYLKASTPGSADYFGTSVAVTNDCVLVGAIAERSTGIGGGAVYAYTKTGSVWGFEATLKPTITNLFQYFGTSLSAFGDSVAIGAYGEEAAYVFVRNSGVWSQQARLTASNSASGDAFGWSVGLSGNVLIVGAYNEDSNATGINGNESSNDASAAGAAYTFHRYGSTWAQTAYMKASNAQSNDRFGYAVAASGDTAIVGAWLESSNATGVGGNEANNSLSGAGASYAFTGLIPPPEISIFESGTEITSGSSEDFGTVGIGSDVDVTFSITNVGGMNLLLNGSPTIVIGGPDAAHFALTEIPTTSLASGMTTSMKLRFAPTSAGVKSAFISLANNDSDENPYTIHLSGTAASPEIAVEQPSGIPLADGVSVISFGDNLNGTSTTRTFTLRNVGNANLSINGTTCDGADSSSYAINIAGMNALIMPGGSTTFSVTFTANGMTSGSRVAGLHIASNDADRNPFDILLVANAFSAQADADGDGLNDWAEFQYAPLGFNWEVNQSALVSTLMSAANSANLYTPSQIQMLNVNTPLLSRNPQTGEFLLTLGLEKSTNLTDFITLPITASQTQVDGTGRIQIRITSPENAAFFLLKSE